MRKSYLFLLLFAQTIVFAQRVINLNDDKLVSLKKSAAATVPQEYLKEAKLLRTFAVNPILQHVDDISVGDIVSLQMFENQNYTSTISAIATDINGTLTLTLALPEYPIAYGSIITGRDGKSLVNVTIPELDKVVVSRSSIASDTSYLIEIDKEQTFLHSEGVEVPQRIPLPLTEEESFKSTSNKDASKLKTITAACTPPVLAPADPAQIDVLILYTPAAAAWAATAEGGINNTIAGAMAQTKAVVDNQGDGDQVRLVHSQLVDYTEHLADAMRTDLNRLTDVGDGYLDEAHQLREQYNADIVVLLVWNSEIGGLGWILNNVNGDLDYGFNTIRVQQASRGTTSIHEIGHNMGMRHNTEDDSSGTPLFPYAFGWHWTGNDGVQYGSVMSYKGRGTPYFSNPDITYQGIPTGTATANNAQVFKNTKHAVAFYSNRLSSLLSVPTGIVVSNTTSGGATISWNACEGAVKYEVRIFASGSSGGYYSLETRNPALTFNYNNFTPCTTYWFFVRAINECGDASSSSIYTFTTRCTTDPTVTTQAASGITDNSATLNKTVVAGSEAITEEGFYYRKPSDNDWTLSATGILTGLSVDTEYQFYAYAQTASNVFNGSVLTFATSACDVVDQIIYTIEMNDRYGDGWDGASLLVKQAGVNIQTVTLLSGSSGIENVSFCPCLPIEFVWRKGSYDGECFFVIKDNSGNTLFTSYMVENYANNRILFSGTSFCVIPPTVRTQEAVNVTTNSAVLNKTVVAGSETIIEEGFYYKESSDGGGSWISSMTGVLTGLSANAEYQFYAYAATALKTVNGDVLMFTTGKTTDVDVVNVDNVVIFPNPVKDELRIMNYKLQEGGLIQITDFSGRVISTYEPQIISSEEIKINVSTLPQGVYLLKMDNFTGRFIKK